MLMLIQAVLAVMTLLIATAVSMGAEPAKPAGKYADVNGLKLDHDVHGEGKPLATDCQVIAVELQGHEHTEDIDRPRRWPTTSPGCTSS